MKEAGNWRYLVLLVLFALLGYRIVSTLGRLDSELFRLEVSLVNANEEFSAWQAAVNARLAEHGEPPIVLEANE